MRRSSDEAADAASRAAAIVESRRLARWRGQTTTRDTTSRAGRAARKRGEHGECERVSRRSGKRWSPRQVEPCRVEPSQVRAAKLDATHPRRPRAKRKRETSRKAGNETTRCREAAKEVPRMGRGVKSGERGWWRRGREHVAQGTGVTWERRTANAPTVAGVRARAARGPVGEAAGRRGAERRHRVEGACAPPRGFDFGARGSRWGWGVRATRWVGNGPVRRRGREGGSPGESRGETRVGA